MTSMAVGGERTVEGVGADPDVVFAHACGFCKEVWRPVAAELDVRRPGTGWLSVDLLGHGSNTATDGPYSLDAIARDLAAAIEGLTPSVGVGHSSGGAAVARVEALFPGTFRHLVLVEPIIFPPPYWRMDNPLSEAAERRRETFPDRRAAYERFVSGPFASWRPDALAAYVDAGFAEGPAGWTIRCRPTVEAEVFRQGLNHDTWSRLPGIEVPVTIVAGEGSDTHRDPYLTKLAGRFRDATVVVVPDAGHFVPMERPDVVASIVADALDRL